MLKTLLSRIKQYKKAAILTPVFMLGEVFMEVLIPFLMASLIDKGITAGNLSYIERMGIALLLAALLALLFGSLSGVFAARASAGFAHNLRQDMFYNVQNFSFYNIDKFSTASIITRMTTDVTYVQNAFQVLIRVAVRAPAMLIFSLAMAFSIDIPISLIFLGAIPILASGLFIIITKVHPIFRRVFEQYDELNNIVQENLRGIRVVKTYVQEESEKKKFAVISDDIYHEYSRAEKIIAFNAPLMQLCMNGCILLISWIGARQIVSGLMSTGELMSMIAYSMQILMSLMMLSFVFVMIIISRASAERITELLNEKTDLANAENPVTDVKNGSVSFENVNFSYTKDKDKFCLSDANIEIKSGETVGLIGSTGSSKTTLIQLIPRLYDATEGRILVGGIDVRNYDIESLRNQVAVVLQKNTLFSGTVKENLRWGNKEASDEELTRCCKLAQADEFIRSFPGGYDYHIEQDGSNVSGGQKQRLCIARALLKKPKILILDDSTSAVDTKTDSLIRKAFKEELPNTTKFIISQRISSVIEADKIIVMDGGKINAVGTHEELLKTNHIYSEVYNSQMQGGDFDE